ncbi:hypothetical protein MHYP_G00059510 [Metynnis hypsauchen]
MKTTDNSLHPIFHMYLEEDDGKKKFLLSARNINTTMTANYVVSVDPSGWYHEGENVVGKLRSNMLGTKFTSCGKSSTNSKNSRALLKGRSPEQELTTIRYEADLMGAEGPRKMSVIIPGMNVNSERLTSTSAYLHAVLILSPQLTFSFFQSSMAPNTSCLACNKSIKDQPLHLVIE